MKSLIKVDDTDYNVANGAMAKKLPSGVYAVNYNGMSGETSFERKITNNDKIIDLPGTAYDQVTTEIDQFLLPETKKKFEDKGFLYKRSFLLHGVPGGGKSSIISRVIEKVEAINGIVLLPRNAVSLAMGFDALKHTNPDTLTLVVLEEFEQHLQADEGSWLLLLDGEIQMRNVIYIAATNYLDKIPHRVLRPGRFSSIVEVGLPGVEARKAYLSTKFADSEVVRDWTKITDGLSIDEIKEVVLASECLGQSRADVIRKVHTIKKATGDYAEYKSSMAEIMKDAKHGHNDYEITLPSDTFNLPSRF